MNATVIKAMVVFVLVALVLMYSAAAFWRQRTAWSSLLFIGALFVVVVVLTHVAEALHLFPAMGWGEPRSVGHYVDLTSAVVGIVLLALGVVLRVRTKIA
ncbi:MAG TPA: hypothetical protein VKE51_16855 [Vicinamibacterales bacterium]|nr:hypothetical protein [Vicinamibacterales bacterium]